MESEQPIEIRPQPGPQTAFLQSAADIVGYGGAAGGGKSFAELLEMVYHVGNPRFRGLILRRTFPMLKQSGGLIDQSHEVYRPAGGELNLSSLEWKFPSGATVQFDGCEHENNRFDFLGSQFDVICFDELGQFPESVFWLLQSRLRGTSGIRPSCKFTLNPDCDHFTRRLLAWWIDQDTGLAIKERSGVLRWFIRAGDELHWAGTSHELVQLFGPTSEPKSMTFIPSSVFDNKILLEKSPGYVATLKSLPLVDRARFLEGNFNIRAAAGSLFKREWFGVVDSAPADIVARCRFWDRAATEKRTGNDPDATVGLLMSKDSHGVYYIGDVQKLFASPHAVETEMRNCAEQDGKGTTVAYSQDPGSAGVAEAQATARALDGFNVRFATASGSKEVRAKPVSAQAEAGNVKIVRGLWNDEFLRILENFPIGKHDDEVDALSGAHETLLNGSDGAFTAADVESMRGLNASPYPVGRLSRFPTGINLRRLGM